MAERISAVDFDARVLGASGTVLVDFYSDSCVPCKRIVPQLAKLEAAHTDAGDLAIVRVNTNFDADLAAKYGVMAAPTLVVFRDGKEVARATGFKRVAELEELVASA